MAKTDVDRETGFMFRSKIDSDEAMLFIYQTKSPKSMWMKNCEVALDIASLSENGTVLETTSLPPEINGKTKLQSVPSFTFTKPSRIILEVKEGTFRKLGVKPGSRVYLTGQ